MGIKKTILKWAAIAGILATTASCTADIDTFGTSDYRVLNEISFEEQDGRPSINANEQRIAVKLSSNKDCSWDSVTIDDLSISSLATFHTVLDSIGSFPKDSTVLDSLARKVSYESKKNQDRLQDRNSRKRHSLHCRSLGKWHSRPLANRLLEALGIMRHQIRQGFRQRKFFFGKERIIGQVFVLDR